MEPFEIDRDELMRAIDECGLFASIDGEVLSALADSFDGVRLATGQTLMIEGEIAHELYIVRHGRLRATVVAEDGTEATVGEIGKNEVVGEMGVITDQERSSTVRATRDSDLFRLPAEAFGRLQQQHPELLRPFATVVVERLREAMSSPAAPSLPATIVVVMLADVDAREFAVHLAASLIPYRTTVVTSDDAVGREHVAGWLLDIENAGRPTPRISPARA